MRLPAAALLALSVCSVRAQSTCSIYFAGDMMQHKAQISAARMPDGTYSYADCFTHMLPEISGADAAVCNFETTLAGRPFTGYPQFCSPVEFATAVRDAGFDVFLTANNHCMDRGSRGLVRTIEVLDSLGVSHLGTYRDAAERDSLTPFMLECNGIHIALLNYTYDTNGIQVSPPRIVNYIDTTVIASDIRKARARQADCVIACMHWGTEYRTEPDRQQIELERWLYENGVDHVIGGHPHVVQPTAVRRHPYYAADCLTVWSLGNYISNMSAPRTDHGLAVTLHLKKTGNVTVMTGYDLHPNRVDRSHFTVLPE